jgi:hypothetical protein
MCVASNMRAHRGDTLHASRLASIGACVSACVSASASGEAMCREVECLHAGDTQEERWYKCQQEKKRSRETTGDGIP